MRATCSTSRSSRTRTVTPLETISIVAGAIVDGATTGNLTGTNAGTAEVVPKRFFQ